MHVKDYKNGATIGEKTVSELNISRIDFNSQISQCKISLTPKEDNHKEGIFEGKEIEEIKNIEKENGRKKMEKLKEKKMRKKERLST